MIRRAVLFLGLLVGLTLLAGAPGAVALSRLDVAGVDIDAVVDAAASDHVAVLPGATADRAALVGQVQRARAANIPLTVVSLPDALSPSDAELVANDVLRQVRGTVLVLTPDGYAAVSDSVGASRMQSGLDAIASDSGDDASVTTAFVDVLTGDGFPWTLLLLVAGGVVLFAVIGVTLWGHRKRAAAAHRNATASLDQLRARLNTLAELVLTLTARMDAADPQVRERFGAAGGEYTALRAAVDDARGTDQLDALTERVSALRDELSAIRGIVDPAGPSRY